MALQPRRSALVMTRRSRQRSAFFVIHSRHFPLIILALTIVVGIGRAHSNFNNDHVVVHSSLAQPKFGDRLQPRNKQISSFSSAYTNRSSVVKYLTSKVSAESDAAAKSDSEVENHLDPRVSYDGSENRFKNKSNGESYGRETSSLRRNDDGVDEIIGGINTIETVDESVGNGYVISDAGNNLNVSKADRLIEMSTEFFIIPSSTTTERVMPSITSDYNPAESTNQLHNIVQPRPVLILAPKNPSIPQNNTSSATPPSVVSTHLPRGLRKEPWVVPVLVLASLTMIMMAAFEIFVLFKAWRTSPSRRHLFLGQMLLLGLFACAGLGAIITAQPTVLSCGAIRFGTGVAYALVFAALLVKCVFLISLNGGVYLPAPYHGLLLLFAVLIQVAIGTQWLVTQPPDIYTMTTPFGGSTAIAGTASIGNGLSVGKLSSMLITSSDITRLHHGSAVMIPLCKTQFSELLFSLIYIVFLIVFVAVLAIKSRGIRDNYREATYIGLAIGGAIPIWFGWMLCGLAVADRHKDACIAFGLVATSATVFLVMFMAKGRQLAAMGKEGLYVEDREEQFSSLSRAGSGYSPSFFHFKPIKYGVVGPMQNSTTNTGNGNSSKHTISGGAHLTHPFCFYPQPPPPQLSSQLPPTLKGLGSSLTSMAPAHLAQTIRYPGLFIRPDETNLYTTLEPTLSSNPNVYFQRSGGVHPGMMY